MDLEVELVPELVVIGGDGFAAPAACRGEDDGLWTVWFVAGGALSSCDGFRFHHLLRYLNAPLPSHRATGIDCEVSLIIFQLPITGWVAQSKSTGAP